MSASAAPASVGTAYGPHRGPTEGGPAAPSVTGRSITSLARAAVDFSLPPELEAATPPEARGLARDQVRLMVGWRHRRDLAHTMFRQLPDYLNPGDLLVVNNSVTLPAAVDVVPADAAGGDGLPMELHFSTRLDADLWVVEPRRAAWPASQPFAEATAGMVLALPGGGRAELLAPYGTPGRLWTAALELAGPTEEWLSRHGRAIRYRYVPRDWPIEYYQTVFATEFGSAEMPSAARPFQYRPGHRARQPGNRHRTADPALWGVVAGSPRGSGCGTIPCPRLDRRPRQPHPRTRWSGDRRRYHRGAGAGVGRRHGGCGATRPRVDGTDHHRGARRAGG